MAKAPFTISKAPDLSSGAANPAAARVSRATLKLNKTLAAAAAGNYILAMGGSASSGRVNTVDIFQFGCQHNNLCKSNNKNKL